MSKNQSFDLSEMIKKSAEAEKSISIFWALMTSIDAGSIMMEQMDNQVKIIIEVPEGKNITVEDYKNNISQIREGFAEGILNAHRDAEKKYLNVTRVLIRKLAEAKDMLPK